MLKSYQFLLIGQGLAGSSLAMQLLLKNYDFLVCDLDNPNSATNISAGIANPLYGKNLNLDPLHYEYFSNAKIFYNGVEKILNTQILQEKRIFRVFLDNNQKQIFNSKKDNPKYNQYIEKEISENFYIDNFHTPHGGFITKNSFFINLSKYKKSVAEFLKSKELLINKKFDFSDLKEDGANFVWQDYKFKKIIFCNGYFDLNQQVYEDVRFRPAKGELLNLKIPDLSEEYIINFGKFILPLGNKEFRLGATYSWDSFDFSNSEKAKSELLNEFSKYCKLPYEFISQKAGIRPIISGNKPIYQQSKTNQNIFIFNGLGSKGVLYGPYYSKLLLDKLV